MSTTGFEYRYKVILLGDVGVGKTSLFNRIKLDEFKENPSTIGSDVYKYSTKVGDDDVTVMLWDTAGAEQFRTLSDHYYREACGGLLVYCVEDTYTFESLQEWIDDANRRIKSDKFVWALLGNKSDLYNEIGEERVEAQCQLMNTDLSYQCSAKTGENVMEAFNAVVVAIHKSQSAIKLQQSTTSGDTIEFDEPQGGSNNSHKCSC